jgi:Domain of unknown function (DUF1992)
VDIFQKIAEDRIQEAQREGLFDNLPGKGKPLQWDDDGAIPEDLRLTFKILKNSNCLPIEMELRKDILNLRRLLDAAIDPETRQELRRDLNALILRLNCLRRGSSVWRDLHQI